MKFSCGERFPKLMRLRKRSEFVEVQQKGAKVQSSGFIGLVLVRGAGRTRLGITTSKRLGNAAVRNRTRRFVREAFRRGLMNLPEGIDLVVIAKKKACDLCALSAFDDLSSLGGMVRDSLERRS